MMSISIAQSICIEYDEILLDHRKTFSVSHFGENTEEDVDYNAKTVVRYAFDTYLRWPRPVLEKRLTMQILEKLKLQNVIKYLRLPIEYDKEGDLFYLVSYVYDRYLPGLRLRTLHLYEKVLMGKVQKFPKEYFSGLDGIRRALVCLNYVVNQEYPYATAEELYELSSSKRWKSFLQKTKLQPVWKPLFSSPVDYLHLALPSENQSDFLSHYYEYLYFLNQKKSADRLIRQCLIGKACKKAS